MTLDISELSDSLDQIDNDSKPSIMPFPDRQASPGPMGSRSSSEPPGRTSESPEIEADHRRASLTSCTPGSAMKRRVASSRRRGSHTPSAKGHRGYPLASPPSSDLSEKKCRNELCRSGADVCAVREQLEELGMDIKKVGADGNCMYRALSDQLYGCVTQHVALRTIAVEYIRRHRDYFENFTTGGMDNQLKAMATPGTYADHIELQAMARVLNATIVIHRLNAAPERIPPRVDNGTELHISYHDGNHYNSVRWRDD